MSVLAWHWSADGMACRYDGRPTDGRHLRGMGALVPASAGLHASVGLLDLAYAPGTTLHRVRLKGEILRGADKLMASERTVL